MPLVSLKFSLGIMGTDKPDLIFLWTTVCSFDTDYNVNHLTKNKSHSGDERQTCTSEADEKH